MRRSIAVGACALAALAVAGVSAGEALQSGVPVGKRVSAWSPLNVTGAAAGKKVCQV